MSDESKAERLHLEGLDEATERERWEEHFAEPLCQCGHPESAHNQTFKWCREEDDCLRFSPSSPPARSRDDAEKAISAVLVDHGDWGFVDVIDTTARCDCGKALLMPEDYGDIEVAHRAHVASVLADLMADAPTLADAWCCRPKDHPGECYPLADPLCDRVPADTEGNQ